MAEDDPKFLRGVDDIVLPLRALTRDIEAMGERVRAHLAKYPELREQSQPRARAVSRGSRFARRLIAQRRQRERLLGPELFGEPAWDMLLDLFVAHKEKARVSVSSLCIGAAVPSTTALRWIQSMTQKEMLIRHSDPTDGRRVWIELAPHMVEKMEALISHWMEASSD